MALDYRERRAVTKNRPKSKPVGLLAAGFVGVAVVSFVLGVAADRAVLLYQAKRTAVAPVQQQPAVEAKASLPASTGTGTQPTQTSPPAQKTGDPALTFYDTLPKGGRALLGTGINPRKEEIRSAVPSRPAAPPAAVEKPRSSDTERPAKVETGGKTAEGVEKKPAAPQQIKKESAGSESVQDQTTKKAAPVSKTKYSVQVASVTERTEAESIKAKLAAKGFAAYIVESAIPGKGTWYRVRVGRHLEQPAASQTATLLGKGAIVVPE